MNLTHAGTRCQMQIFKLHKLSWYNKHRQHNLTTRQNHICLQRAVVSRRMESVHVVYPRRWRREVSFLSD